MSCSAMQEGARSRDDDDMRGRRDDPCRAAPALRGGSDGPDLLGGQGLVSPSCSVGVSSTNWPLGTPHNSPIFPGEHEWLLDRRGGERQHSGSSGGRERAQMLPALPRSFTSTPGRRTGQLKSAWILHARKERFCADRQCEPSSSPPPPAGTPIGVAAHLWVGSLLSSRCRAVEVGSNSKQ